MDLILLIGWIILSMYAVYHWVENKPIHPISYLCAVLVCILHYAEKLLNG